MLLKIYLQIVNVLKRNKSICAKVFYKVSPSVLVSGYQFARFSGVSHVPWLLNNLLLQLKNQIGQKSKAVFTLESRINEIVDRIYHDFSASVGVANIREYEENQLRAAQEMAERRMSLSSQISKLKNQ